MAYTGSTAHDAFLVSVITPAYNHASFIGDTLASVFAQRYPHIEVVVVDDGSTDDTVAQMAEFRDRVIYHRQANRGMAAARNQGIALARGQLISFLDDDDLWEPDYLATVVPLFVANPDVAAVYTGFKSLDAAGQALPQGGTRVVAPERLYDALVDGGFFPACCLTVRKAVLEEIGGLDETLRGNDDWDLLLRLARDRRVIGLPAPQAIHREHAGGLSSNYEHMLVDSLRTVAKHFGPEDGSPLAWPDQRRRAYAGAYFLAAVGHFLQGHTDLGCLRLSRAVEVYPPIAQRVSAWYDVACSYQPKGWRGHAPSLDLLRSERLVSAALRCVLEPFKANEAEKSGEASIQAAAALALGLLAYQKPDMRSARRYFGRAIALQPRLLLDREVVFRCVKSVFGARLLAAARRARQHMASARQMAEYLERVSS